MPKAFLHQLIHSLTPQILQGADEVSSRVSAGFWQHRGILPRLKTSQVP